MDNPSKILSEVYWLSIRYEYGGIPPVAFIVTLLSFTGVVKFKGDCAMLNSTKSEFLSASKTCIKYLPGAKLSKKIVLSFLSK